MQASLEDNLFSKKKLEKKVSMLKDKLGDTFKIYFQLVKEHVAFLHPELNISLMDIFKMVRDGQLMEEKQGPSFDKTIASLDKSTQIEHEGDKVKEVLDEEATHQEVDVEGQ